MHHLGVTADPAGGGLSSPGTAGSPATLLLALAGGADKSVHVPTCMDEDTIEQSWK